jgi:serine/threonine-protein kinase
MLPWAVLAAGVIAVAAWVLWQARQSSAASRDVVHLDIVFPPDVEPVAGRQGGIAISPDGKSIAMVGFTNGQRRLFVRRLDAARAMDLAGTSGGGVFSPDGGSVAFISNATVLTRLSLADGQEVGITSGGDFVAGVSLAWGPKHIFFIRGGSLWRTAPEGGASQQLTSLDTSAGEVLHADPLPLPGGRFLLFTRLTTAQSAPRIESIPTDGGKRAVVVEGGTTPVWSPTGHLLFGRDGAVWAIPFDPEAAVARGPAVQVIPPGVVGTVRSGGLGFQLSATGTLAFVPADFDSKRLVSVGRDGSELPLALPSGSYGNPRISLDGRRIALEREGSAVDLIDVARGTRAVVAPAAIGTNFPTWTSDGAKVVVRSYNVPFWFAADGSGKSAAIPHGDSNTSPGSPGPDADSFIAVRLLPETAGDLYLYSISGVYAPKPLVATPAYEGSPHLSPDRRWLAYQSNASGRPEIYVRRYPALDRAWPVSEGGGVQARWHPSGREILFRGSRQIMSVAFDGSGAEPVLGKPTPLFADVYDFGQGLSIPNYDVTPDGRFLMLRRGTQGGTLRVVLNWTEELKRMLAKTSGQ